MFNFLPIVFIFFSLAGFIYILSRHLENLEITDSDAEENQSIFFGNLANKVRSVELSKQFLPYFEKSLHRARVLTLKVDNNISRWLSKMKPRQEGGEDPENKIWQKFDENKKED